jgi:hypothetical protein
MFFKNSDSSLSGVAAMTVGGEQVDIQCHWWSKRFSKRRMLRCQGFEVWV